jgi:CubicO group peptidase (beta-lactamase class C family)
MARRQRKAAHMNLAAPQVAAHYVRLAGLLLLCGGATAIAFAERRPPQDQTVAPDFAAIEAYISAEMHAERIPGLAVAIVRGTDIVYARGFGTDGSGQQVTPQTSFLIGSMSKSVTALALMQLVDRQLVDLDTPVQHYLPEFRVADRVASSHITVRHLLNHTSGVPTRAPRATSSDATLRSHVAALERTELVHVPGTTHEYSSPNYQVLGALIEQVSGVEFAQFARSNIFEPLEMRHTFTDQQAALRAGMSQGHRYWFGLPRAVTLPHEADRLPTAAIISSAEDLAHFMTAQLNGGRYREKSVLSPKAMGVMHAPGVESEGFGYAMGWRVGRDAAGARVIHHGGIVPHFRGKMVLLPEPGWGVVVLTNASTMLPVPPASHRIADNIGAYLAGAGLPGTTSRTMITFALVAGAVVLLTLHQLRQVVIAWRQRHLPTRLARKQALARAGRRLLMPVALLAGLPLLLRMPWRELVRAMPDIAYWVIIIAAVDMLLILVQLYRTPLQKPS